MILHFFLSFGTEFLVFGHFWWMKNWLSDVIIDAFHLWKLWEQFWLYSVWDGAWLLPWREPREPGWAALAPSWQGVGRHPGLGERSTFYIFPFSWEVSEITSSSYCPLGLGVRLMTGWWCWESAETERSRGTGAVIRSTDTSRTHVLQRVFGRQPGIYQHLRWGSLWLQRDSQVRCGLGGYSASSGTECHHPLSLSEFLTTSILWVSRLLDEETLSSPFLESSSLGQRPDFSRALDIVFSGCMLLVKRSWKVYPWVSGVTCGKLPAWEGLLILMPGPERPMFT